MRLTPRRSTAGLAVVALTAALTITACGDDGGGEPSTPEKLAIEVTEQGKGEFRLSAPESVRAGLVEISVRSPAGETTHDAQVVRVEGDHTVDEVVAAVATLGAPIPRWLIPAGGVGQTAGGAVGRTVQQLEPGKHYILDTDEPEGDKVKSYAETGATAALEVTGEAGAAELPKTDAKVTAKDYTFAVSGLKAGKNEIEFTNAGRQPHHLMAFPYRTGATLDEVKKVFTEEGEGSGPPPLDFAGATRTATLERRQADRGTRPQARHVRARLLHQRSQGRAAARGEGHDRRGSGRVARAASAAHAALERIRVARRHRRVCPERQVYMVDAGGASASARTKIREEGPCPDR